MVCNSNVVSSKGTSAADCLSDRYWVSYIIEKYYAVRGGKLSGPLLVKPNPRCVTSYYGRKVEGFMANFLARVSVKAACREDCFGVMSRRVFSSNFRVGVSPRSIEELEAF